MSSLILTNSIATTGAAASRWRMWTPPLAALTAFAAALISPTVLDDGDTWWHLAAGDWIIAHHAIPRVDPFSFTMAGAPWTAHEWLAELLMALAFRLAGWSGVALIAGVAAASAAAIVATRIARDLDGPPLPIAVALGLSLLSPSFLARPHLLALPILAAWSAGLLAARDRGCAPPPALAALMALWANLHGGFVFGLALIGPFALEALLAAAPAERLDVARRWAGFAALSVAAALLTPHGVEALIFPFRLLTMTSLAQIGEWQAASFAHIQPLETALFVVLALALRRPVSMPPVRLALLLGLLYLALAHGRHQMLVGVIAPMLLAAPVAKALGSEAEPPARDASAAWPVFIAAAAALALVAFRAAWPIVRVDGPTAPIAGLAATPPALRLKPALNAYDFGGYLIWSGVRPFVDGRADMYGDRFLARYRRLAAADPATLDETLTQDGVAWTMFPPSSPVVAAMDRQVGWRRLYAGPFAVVHARVDALDPD